MPPDFNFTSFRSRYSQTEQYDPVGAAVKKRMLDYYFEISQGADPAKIKKALRGYQTLVMNHLASIDVVTLAQALSRQNSRLGPERVYAWVRKGLTESLVYSGDGGSISGAYDVITTGEEAVLLRELKVVLLATESHHEGAIYYNIYRVKDRATGATREIYVDLSLPMKALEAQKEKASIPLNIPRQ